MQNEKNNNGILNGLSEAQLQQIESDALEAYEQNETTAEIEELNRIAKEDKEKREKEHAERILNIQKNHLLRITRDLNELCDCYKEELELKVTFTYKDYTAKPFFVIITFEPIHDNAAICAEQIAEIAHARIRVQSEEIYNQTLIDVYEN